MAALLKTLEKPDYRRLLEHKAEEVRHGLSAHRASEIVRRPDEPLDFGDWCQKSHDEWLFLNQNRIAIELLREVQHALRRIDNGTFGTCQGCGEPISRKRLEAVPWARCCLPCQQNEGRREEEREETDETG